MSYHSRSQQTRNSLLALGPLAISKPGIAQKPPLKESLQERLAKAQAMFQERCKTAGEKIFRTAENVEGIFLMKLRLTRNLANQFVLDDPYGRDFVGDGYIETFVRGSYQANTRGSSAPRSPHRLGYDYVETIDLKDNKKYRYTGSVREVEVKLSGMNGGGTARQTKFVLSKTISRLSPPHYGVTYDDISTREEREYWIAGSSLKVIDLRNNEVMAERIGYMMDRGQGNTSGGRSPWLMAASNACPGFHRNRSIPLVGPAFSAQAHQTQDFVEKIIKPKLEN